MSFVTYTNVPVYSVDYKMEAPAQQSPQQPKFMITLADQSKTQIYLVMEDKEAGQVDAPIVDQNGICTCYAPIGLTETIKKSFISNPKASNMVFTGGYHDDYKKYLFTLISNNQPLQPKSDFVSGQLSQYSLTVSNWAAGLGPNLNDNFAAFNFWCVNPGGPGIEVDLWFSDPKGTFPPSTHEQADGALYHFEMPGEQGPYFAGLLNEIHISKGVATIDDKNLSFTFTYPAPNSISYVVSAPYIQVKPPTK